MHVMFYLKGRKNKRHNEVLCTRKESQEALRSTVDDINFVKSDSVNNFFSLLYLSFRTLNKPGLKFTKK